MRCATLPPKPLHSLQYICCIPLCCSATSDKVCSGGICDGQLHAAGANKKIWREISELGMRFHAPRPQQLSRPRHIAANTGSEQQQTIRMIFKMYFVCIGLLLSRHLCPGGRGLVGGDALPLARVVVPPGEAVAAGVCGKREKHIRVPSKRQTQKTAVLNASAAATTLRVRTGKKCISLAASQHQVQELKAGHRREHTVTGLGGVHVVADGMHANADDRAVWDEDREHHDVSRK